MIYAKTHLTGNEKTIYVCRTLNFKFLLFNAMHIDCHSGAL